MAGSHDDRFASHASLPIEPTGRRRPLLGAFGWGRVLGAMRSVWPRSVLGSSWRRSEPAGAAHVALPGIGPFDDPVTEPWGASSRGRLALGNGASSRPALGGGVASLGACRRRLLTELGAALDTGRLAPDEAQPVRTEVELATCWAELWSLRTACFGLLARAFSEGEAVRRLAAVDEGFPIHYAAQLRRGRARFMQPAA